MEEATSNLYTGGSATDECITVIDDDTGENPVKHAIRFQLKKPDDANGQERDQTFDAARNMRYAATLNLPELAMAPRPRLGRAVIVGGAPSVKNHLEEIRQLSLDPHNAILPINWTHTWLINNGIVPRGCVFFEIDVEPDTVLRAAHPDVTYFICSHCHHQTFDALQGMRRVLWHSPPNSDPEREVSAELFASSHHIGGGISTFTRTITIALTLGYRHLDIFGCDSSFPEQTTTHVDGYETIMDARTDGLYVWARSDDTGEVRRYRTLGYLALQVEEFKQYCAANHHVFSMRVHGEGLLPWVHRNAYPEQYADR